MEPSATVGHPLPRGLLLRGVGLISVLAAELLGLTIRFDAGDVANREHWWARGLGWSPMVLAGLLAFSAAFLLVVSPRLKAIARSLADESIEHRWEPWLSLQLVAVGVFALCTARLFEGGSESVGWVVGWGGAAVAAAILWLLAVAPARCWWAMARHEHMAMLVAAVAGGAAVASGRGARELWTPLAGATFWLVERLLGTMYSHIVSVPSTQTLGTPAFQVEIAPQCSGYEGIALILVFGAVYLWLFRRELRFPHTLLLLPVGVLAIWFANVLRITALIALGTSVSAGVALGGFHSQAGWLFFLAVSLGLMAASHHVRLFAAPAMTRPEASGRLRDATEAAALLVPALVLLASVMVTSAVSSGFDGLYPLRVGATAIALWHFRAAYRRLDWRWTWESAVIGGVVFVLWLGLEAPANVQGRSVEDALARLSPGVAVLWLGCRVIGSTVTVPLAEEFAFRGYLIRKLVSPAFESVRPGSFTWLSFVGSSVLFGALHGRWLAGTLAGMVYAVALYRRGRVAEAVYAHMTTNALIAAYVLWSGRWSMWA
jgi:exosortase E/protease (VPEID-CTERM system)